MSNPSIELITEDELNEMKKHNAEQVEINTTTKEPSEIVQEINESNDEWIHLDTLPSGYKPYPKGCRFAYRKYIYNEILKINNPDLKLFQKYNIMLKGIKSVGNVEVNPNILTFDDFLYISIVRKLESFGTTSFVSPYVCPFCGNEGKATFKLNELEFDIMKAPKLPAKVYFSQYPDEEFLFSPITIGDAIWLLSNDVFYMKDEDGVEILSDNGQPIYDDIAYYARQCINHNFEEAYKKIYHLNNEEDMNLLTELNNLFKHGIKPYKFKCACYLKSDEKLPDNYDKMTEPEKEIYNKKLEFLREQCGKELSLSIGGDTIILPFRESSQLKTSRICFD